MPGVHGLGGVGHGFWARPSWTIQWPPPTEVPLPSDHHMTWPYTTPSVVTEVHSCLKKLMQSSGVDSPAQNSRKLAVLEALFQAFLRLNAFSQHDYIPKSIIMINKMQASFPQIRFILETEFTLSQGMSTPDLCTSGTMFAAGGRGGDTQCSQKSNLFKCSLVNSGLFWGHVIPLSTWFHEKHPVQQKEK